MHESFSVRRFGVRKLFYVTESIYQKIFYSGTRCSPRTWTGSWNIGEKKVPAGIIPEYCLVIFKYECFPIWVPLRRLLPAQTVTKSSIMDCSRMDTLASSVMKLPICTSSDMTVLGRSQQKSPNLLWTPIKQPACTIELLPSWALALMLARGEISEVK